VAARPPAVVVHDLAQARAALAAAAEAGREIRLLTPPGGAHYAGAPYYAEVFRQAALSVPGARFIAILDCGDDAALAVTALAAGWRCLVLARGGRAFARVADIAGQHGAELLRRPPAGLDLGAEPEPLDRCRRWLAAGPATLKA
jgi:hypothetical protein